MFTVLVGFLFGFVIGCFFGCFSGYSEDILPTGLYMGVTGAILATLIAVCNYAPFTVLPEGSYFIEAMNDSSKLSGSFCLMGGSIEDKPVYACYIKTEYDEYQNAYKQFVFPADTSVIIEEEVSNPYVKVVMARTPESYWKIGTSKILKQYEFHVPPNSIKPGINLDLENR